MCEDVNARQVGYAGNGTLGPSVGMNEQKGSINISIQRVDNGVLVSINGYNPPKADDKQSYMNAYVNKTLVAADYRSAIDMINEYLSQSSI